MSKAGTRKGAGRKPTGSTKILVNIGLAPQLVELLKARIPRGKRTKFIQEAITEKLGK
jgi:hypothetical protein